MNAASRNTGTQRHGQRGRTPFHSSSAPIRPRALANHRVHCANIFETERPNPLLSRGKTIAELTFGSDAETRQRVLEDCQRLDASRATAGVVISPIDGGKREDR